MQAISNNVVDIKRTHFVQPMRISDAAVKHLRYMQDIFVNDAAVKHVCYAQGISNDDAAIKHTHSLQPINISDAGMKHLWCVQTIYVDGAASPHQPSLLQIIPDEKQLFVHTLIHTPDMVIDEAHLLDISSAPTSALHASTSYENDIAAATSAYAAVNTKISLDATLSAYNSASAEISSCVTDTATAVNIEIMLDAALAAAGSTQAEMRPHVATLQHLLLLALKKPWIFMMFKLIKRPALPPDHASHGDDEFFDAFNMCMCPILTADNTGACEQAIFRAIYKTSLTAEDYARAEERKIPFEVYSGERHLRLDDFHATGILS